jgi:hypothetical protein
VLVLDSAGELPAYLAVEAERLGVPCAAGFEDARALLTDASRVAASVGVAA